MPTKKSLQPKLPARITEASGKLIVVGSTGSAQLALHDTKFGRIFRLNNGDHILLKDKLILVKHAYCGRDRLNGYLGFYIKGPNHPQLAQTQQLFLHRVPCEADNLKALTDAYFHETEMTIKFAAKPLADKNTGFVSGNLLYYYEQGMESVLYSVHDREHAGYDGLNIIEIGDVLTVYNAKGTHVVWQGRMTQKRLQSMLAANNNRKKVQSTLETLRQAFFLELPVLLKKAKKA